MSRSRRKHPVLKDGGQSHKEFKQMSNRMGRHVQEDLPPKGTRAHRAWRRLYRYEDVVETISRMSRQDAVRAWRREEQEHVRFTPLHDRHVTLERWLAYWKRHYICK